MNKVTLVALKCCYAFYSPAASLCHRVPPAEIELFSIFLPIFLCPSKMQLEKPSFFTPMFIQESVTRLEPTAKLPDTSKTQS